MPEAVSSMSGSSPLDFGFRSRKASCEAEEGSRWNRREFLHIAGAAMLGALVLGGRSRGVAAGTHAVAANHDFVFRRPPAEPLQGLLLGNGDLGVSLWAEGNTLVLSLGKNDVWDRRLNTNHDQPVVNLDPPETGTAGETLWLRQRIPADPTFPQGFAVVAAAALAGACKI